MDENFLDHFHQLATTVPEPRCRAGFQIIHRMERDEKKAEYALTRLVRGLVSANGAARQGFATTLAELLARHPEQISDTLALAEQQFRKDNDAVAASDRDVLLGRLCLYKAVLSVDAELSSKIELKVVSGLRELFHAKSYLQAPATRTLLSYLENINQDKTSKADRVAALARFFIVNGEKELLLSEGKAKPLLAGEVKNMHHMGLVLALRNAGGKSKNPLKQKLPNVAEKGKNLNSLLHYLVQYLKPNKENYTDYQPWFFEFLLQELYPIVAAEGTSDQNLAAADNIKATYFTEAEQVSNLLFDAISKALHTTAIISQQDQQETTNEKSNKNNKIHAKQHKERLTQSEHVTKKCLALLQLSLEHLKSATAGAAALPALWKSCLVQAFCASLASASNKKQTKNEANEILEKTVRKCFVATGEEKNSFACADLELKDKYFYQAYENLVRLQEYKQLPPRLQRSLLSLLVSRLSVEKANLVAVKVLNVQNSVSSTKLASAGSAPTHLHFLEPELIHALTAHPKASRHVQLASLAAFLLHFANPTADAKREAQKVLDSTSVGAENKNGSSIQLAAMVIAGQKVPEEKQKVWRAQFWKLLNSVLKKCSKVQDRLLILRFVYLFRTEKSLPNIPESVQLLDREMSDGAGSTASSASTGSLLQLMLSVQCVQGLEEGSREKMEETLEQLGSLVTFSPPAGKKQKKNKDSNNSKSTSTSQSCASVDAAGVAEFLPQLYADMQGFVKEAVERCWTDILPPLFQDFDNEADPAMAEELKTAVKYVSSDSVARSRGMMMLLALCGTLFDEQVQQEDEDAEGSDVGSDDEDVEVGNKEVSEDDNDGEDDDDEHADENQKVKSSDRQLEDSSTAAGVPSSTGAPPTTSTTANPFEEIAVADEEQLLTILTEDDANEEMKQLGQAFGVNNETNPKMADQHRRQQELKSHLANIVKQIKYLDLLQGYLDFAVCSGSSSSSGSSGGKAIDTELPLFALDILQQLFDALKVASKRCAKLTSGKGQQHNVNAECTSKLRDIVRKNCEKVLRKVPESLRKNFGEHVVSVCQHQRKKLPALFEAGGIAAVSALAGAEGGAVSAAGGSSSSSSCTSGDNTSAARSTARLQGTVVKDTLLHWIKKDDTKWAPTFLKAVSDRFPATFVDFDFEDLFKTEGAKPYCKNEIRSFLVHLLQRNYKNMVLLRKTDTLVHLCLDAMDNKKTAELAGKDLLHILECCLKSPATVGIMEKQRIEERTAGLRQQLQDKNLKNKVYKMLCQAEKLIAKLPEYQVKPVATPSTTADKGAVTPITSIAEKKQTPATTAAPATIGGSKKRKRSKSFDEEAKAGAVIETKATEGGEQAASGASLDAGRKGSAGEGQEVTANPPAKKKKKKNKKV
ncbi:unnamed protein product [Amoebophrya sp. A120]|nr:unnamed protein product [Amoebophrya sp. A120]|eukprot:GSA120T00024955001.1